jgi:hypothetical protein
MKKFTTVFSKNNFASRPKKTNKGPNTNFAEAKNLCAIYKATTPTQKALSKTGAVDVLPDL